MTGVSPLTAGGPGARLRVAPGGSSWILIPLESHSGAPNPEKENKNGFFFFLLKFGHLQKTEFRLKPED